MSMIKAWYIGQLSAECGLFEVVNTTKSATDDRYSLLGS